jgi:hypothetical protein
MGDSGWILDMLASVEPKPEVTPERAAVAETDAPTEAAPTIDAPPEAALTIDALADLSLEPAVAERQTEVGETEVAEIPNPRIRGAWASNHTTPCPSIAGDTIADSSAAENDESDAAVAERRGRRRAPRSTFEGDRQRRTSSKWNEEPEVGNFGIFFGNWGTRATLGGRQAQQRRREIQDRQVVKSPAQVIVLAEASSETEEVLRTGRNLGDPTTKGLQSRDDHDHYVIRGNEESAILIAARTDNTTGIELLEYFVSNDHDYTEKGKKKQARSRIIVGKVYFKQNVGHIGKEVVLAGVHGHYRTMKHEWPQAHRRFWDSLANKIRSHGVKLLAGDFNMSLTQVPLQLRSRNITCDCIAWYPWRHETMRTHGQSLGFDSCGIFYIGGSIKATLTWSLEYLPELTAVADQMKDLPLDVYSGQNHPGQHWSAYREKAYKENDYEKNLQQRLKDLLTPSTTAEELERIPRREGTSYCSYLRFKEKALDKKEWLDGDQMHNGAHFPLCVFTKNSSARSEEATKARAERSRNAKGKGKGGKDNGKGQHSTAVAGRKGGKVREEKGKAGRKDNFAVPLWDGKGAPPGN